MMCVRSLARWALLCAIAAAVLISFSPAVATAQSVSGHGKIDNGPGLSPSEISVNAWIDADGIVQGMVNWTGDIANSSHLFWGTGGPADPWHIAVYDLEIQGNSALVTGVVVNSPGGQADGQVVQFLFTDNSGTGEPDEINGQPILAGNISIDD
jgi:hypothetical protein